MNEDFRKRVFVPLLLPLLLFAGFFVFSFSISRVLLAVSEMAAVFIALLIAAYVLVVAFFVSARPQLPARALGVGIIIGMVGVAAAGGIGAAAGIRPIEHEEEEHEEENDEEVADIPDDALLFVSVDNEFTEAPDTAEAGELTFALDNQGGSFHDVVIEEIGDEEVVGAEGGETDVGTVELDAGTYTYYCSVPGHRATMEGTLEVQ